MPTRAERTAEKQRKDQFFREYGIRSLYQQFYPFPRKSRVPFNTRQGVVAAQMDAAMRDGLSAQQRQSYYNRKCAIRESPPAVCTLGYATLTGRKMIRGRNRAVYEYPPRN